MPPGPTLETELALIEKGTATVGGMDEVGRGALAGPVCVGVVVVGASTSPPPAGLADSKLLSPARREHLIPQLAEWGLDRSLGWASAAEIDREGIVGALRLAGLRALGRLKDPPAVVLLDGKHNWLSAPDDLFGSADPAPWRVHMKVKADLHCACVAAASVLAKVARDQRMVELAAKYPAYGWQANKGYGAPAHLAALEHLGLSPEHRQSWALPGRRPPDVRS